MRPYYHDSSPDIPAPHRERSSTTATTPSGHFDSSTPLMTIYWFASSLPSPLNSPLFHISRLLRISSSPPPLPIPPPVPSSPSPLASPSPPLPLPIASPSLTDNPPAPPSLSPAVSWHAHPAGFASHPSQPRHHPPPPPPQVELSSNRDQEIHFQIENENLQVLLPSPALPTLVLFLLQSHFLHSSPLSIWSKCMHMRARKFTFSPLSRTFC